MLLPDYLHGAIDLHVHSAPDVDVRRFDDFELAREAARAGMAGVLLKSHQTSTVERAFLVQKIVPDIRVYGGIALNYSVGGLNPAAVEVALALGARQVWMPTRSARNHRRAHKLDGGITIFDADGAISPDVDRILEMIAGSSGCVLGTGHLGPDEVFPLVERARKLGAARVLITHPEWSATYYSIEDQRRLAAFGNVFFERCFVSTTHRCGFTPMLTIENAIAAVGIGTTVLSTDLGQPDTPPPAEGFRMYAEALRAAGFSVDDLRTMMASNPALLLGATASGAAPEPARSSETCGIASPSA